MYLSASLATRFRLFMKRYSVITDKKKREIVLLRGSGCVYKQCVFCDYHADRCPDPCENYALNKSILDRVTGEYGELEVINSGSVFELDDNTIEYIKYICADRGITTVHFEAHYLYRNKISKLRNDFAPLNLKMKLGLETFERDFRENILHKGIPEDDPSVICRGFDEANFLFGISGQSAATMTRDIELGLKHFERICVNIMCENSTTVKPDEAVIAQFMSDVYPLYKDDPRVDILIENTDFGVGDQNE